ERLRHAFHDPIVVALLDELTEELAPDGFALLLLSGNSGRSGTTPEQVSHTPMDVRGLGHHHIAAVTMPATQPSDGAGWLTEPRRSRSELPTSFDRLRRVEDTLG